MAKYAYGAALAEARGRTLSLVAPVNERNLNRQHHPLMSPLVWDLGHIAAFEDLWLCRSSPGLEPLRPELSDVYDAAETPRAGRGDIPYLRREEALEFMQQVHERALAVLEGADISADGDRLNAGAFVWEMLIQHEHQHNETMLQTLQLVGPDVYSPTRGPLPPPPPGRGESTVEVPGGPFLMGDPDLEFAYDNERPRHEVYVDAFRIDRTPVTNGAYMEFVADGGYTRRELWDPAGWDWRVAEGVERPLFWSPDGSERRFERIGPIDAAMPVMHVSWFEADAFARWRGARLPTEQEWEKAAAWDPDTGESRRWPWGADDPTSQLANVDHNAFGPAPAGSLPAGASPCGALGMIGDTWEWTASRFDGYDGFAPFPYPEYSEVFFGGDFRVLRGGSWATRPSIARNTFRNWDHPHRRQIFSGFRCAEDVGTSITTAARGRARMAADVRRGLARSPKELAPKYFYDERGSELFDRITTLPEYYPTRCERAILNRHAPDLVEGMQELVELGSGTASKTRALLYALAGAGTLRRYVPFDVDASVVALCEEELAELYPGMAVHGVVGDFEHDLGRIPPGERRLFAFLGGTIGNFHPAQRARFLTQVRELMGPGDRLVLGTDLVKDRATLEAAYDDSEGVTAEFNRNVLRVLNAGLGSDFDPDSFDHVARWVQESSRIEMLLRSRCDQTVSIPGADLKVAFAEGEEMRTEISTKFTPDRIKFELEEAGLSLERLLTDPEGLFAVSVSTAGAPE